MIIDREISLKEAVGMAITVLIVVIGAWVNFRVVVARIDVKVLELENKINQEHSETGKKLEQLQADNKEIISLITDVKIELQNKENRR